MEARAHARHSFTQDFDRELDYKQRYGSERFPSFANQRDPEDSDDQLRLSKQLWDRRWSRWWGYSWRRKRDLALRHQRYLNNRERFLRPVYSENETENCPRKRVSFSGSDHLTSTPTAKQGFRRKLGRFLSASGAQISRAGRCIARRFKRSPPRAKDQPTVPRMDVPPAEWTCPRTWRYSCPAPEERPWHRTPGPPPTDASLHSLEQLSRRLERLRTVDRAAPPRPTLAHRGCGSEYVVGGDIEKEFSRSSLPRSCSRSMAEESRAAFSERQQHASPVVVNMQRNESIPILRDDLKYDRSKLSMNQGLPFMYPHYPNVYNSSGAGRHENRLFSSVATQTDQRQGTGEEKAAAANITLVQGPRTRNSETQTYVIPQRDRETQWVKPCEVSRTFSTQTAVTSSNASQQMPSVSDISLLETQKTNDELINLCSSFVKADSIRSVFGSNKTHVVIYRPELGDDEDNSTIKLTEMEVFLPSAVSYDRYYAELTSDGKASPNLSPRTPRENGQLTESVTPFIEVTSFEDRGEDDIKNKKKKWFCNKH